MNKIRAGDVAQLIEHSPSMQEALDCISDEELGTVVRACNLSTLKAGGLGIQHPYVYSELEVSQSYLRPSVKNNSDSE